MGGKNHNHLLLRIPSLIKINKLYIFHSPILSQAHKYEFNWKISNLFSLIEI
jgi:hypothetical protein